MFNKSTKPAGVSGEPISNSSTSSPSINLVGPGTRIEGEMFSKGDIRIDGVVEGYLNSQAKVVVGPKGFVDGDIDCESADISGKVNGKIKVKGLLFLKNTARISGEINTNKFVVEAGALINGACNVGDYKEIKREKPAVTPGKLKKEAV